MTLLLRFDKGKSDQVCWLKKSLYGLKQSPGHGFDSFSEVLKLKGYKQGLSKYAVFVKAEEGKGCILTIYINDIILIGDHLEEMTRIKIALGKEFKVQDLGNLKYFHWCGSYKVKERYICI